MQFTNNFLSFAFYSLHHIIDDAELPSQNVKKSRIDIDDSKSPSRNIQKRESIYIDLDMHNVSTYTQNELQSIQYYEINRFILFLK